MFLFKISLEGFDRLVIGDIKTWFVPFLPHSLGYLVNGLADDGVGEVFDWDHVDVVGVVIVRHIVEYVLPLIAHTGSALVVSVYTIPAFLSTSATKHNKHVAYLFILWDNMSL